MTADTGDTADLRDELWDFLTDNDVTCGPWCNVRRGTCKDIATQVVDALLPVILADRQRAIAEALARGRHEVCEGKWRHLERRGIVGGTRHGWDAHLTGGTP